MNCLSGNILHSLSITRNKELINRNMSSGNPVIKQFVVSNCSKERPGSIVTEALKKWNFDTNSYIKRIAF